MKPLKKNFFLLFLIIYLLAGSLNSVKTGISFDENYEDLNWNFNLKVLHNLKETFISKKKFDKQQFDKEVKNFVGYGIGFQILSQPIQSVIKNLLLKDENLSHYGAKLLSKHFVVFLFFFASGIIFYLILRKLLDEENFCILGTIVYLTYPYLFGQSMFSPKDIPFLSVWLLCTYLSFNIIEKLINHKFIFTKDIFVISLVTAYLFSIRIAGILIISQYVLLLILYLSIYKINFFSFLKRFYLKLLFFLSNLIVFTFLFNPIFIVDPLLIIETIKINANHFNNVGTNTLGTVMYSKDLPSTYLPIWFAVKLPLIIILGILLLPISEKKIFNSKKRSIFFGNILLTSLFIPLFLILRKVHLYDELRQVMFLIPLIIIIGLISLYTFSKKIFISLAFISVSIFIFENIKINPYQYVWFNLPSRALDLTNKFELEYQGLSGKEISQHLKKLDHQGNCILANPIHGVQPFLNNTNFNCFDIWQKIDTDYKRPFFAVQTVRNLKKSLPYNCKYIYETGFKLLFHNKKFTTGRLLSCE